MGYEYGVITIKIVSKVMGLDEISMALVRAWQILVIVDNLKLPVYE